MTLGEAARRGISRLRKAHWSFPDDVLVLHLLPPSHYGPWATLLSPTCSRAIGNPTIAEQKVLIIGDDDDDWLEAPAADDPEVKRWVEERDVALREAKR